jgi:hypothetical protein
MNSRDDAAERDEQTRTDNDDSEPMYQNVNRGNPNVPPKYTTRKAERAQGIVSDTIPKKYHREAIRDRANKQLAMLDECDCGYVEVELGRQAVLDDDGEYVTDDDSSVVVEPTVECADCRTILDDDPSEEVVEYLSWD